MSKLGLQHCVCTYADILLQREEEDAAQYKASLPPGLNAELALEFRDKVNDMKKRVGLKQHYRRDTRDAFRLPATDSSIVLGNLGTLPEHEGRGAGSALTAWPFQNADRDGISVRCGTNGQGRARKLYERLGFSIVDELTIDLETYGGQGSYNHVLLVREPSPSSRS
jgi:ribosomal protein S18 acetylase RimI-like enzyme